MPEQATEAVQDWTGKILIPHQNIETKEINNATLLKFSFTREGSDKAEKGQVYVHKSDKTNLAQRIEDFMKSESLFEAVVEYTKTYGPFVSIKLPSGQKGGQGGGGGGKPSYKGKTFSEKEFRVLFERVKQGHLDWYKKAFPSLDPSAYSEHVRSEASQWMIMLKDNVWIPG